MTRTVAVVTTSRADYCHLYWPLRELAAAPAIDLKLVVIGPHLSPEFGHTGRQIERDGFAVDARVECALSSDSDVGMAKTIGLATLGLADYLDRTRPDLLLLTADRYEMLAPASVATALRIPLAHIEGGEVSEGAIDDAIRNALTKLSHVHFTSTDRARDRVIAMGEEPWRVHRAGAPSLDHLTRGPLLSREQVEARLGFALEPPTAVVAYHPVTIARDTTREADALFAALAAAPGQILFCYPNADSGGRALIDRARAFVAGSSKHRLFVNLDPILYWSLLRQVDLVLGNSSSGVMEAASFALPAIDVGLRQRGRERGANVLDAPAEPAAILNRVGRALDPEFRAALRGMTNPYGDGTAAARIAAVLSSVPLGEELLVKRSEPRDEDHARWK
jgi:UDP-N-acetylglucosamine 2-epimerase (non-hydrolysing)/GDP/UDP-N,N'-diacetylbacillosamine 2-epimerase (hydrolysing)